MAIQKTIKARKWGNSIGVVLPKDQVEQEGIGPGDEVDVIVRKKRTARKLYGKYRGIFGKSAQEVKDDIRNELYHD